MSEKKMLAILGGPRQNGSTAAMLDLAIQCAQNAGWTVDVVHLYQKKLDYCMGCSACADSKRCILEDDIQEIARLLRECDLVAVAAPTYWANVPAALKNMFDRLFGTVMTVTATFPKPHLSPNQKYLLMTACHTPFFFSWLFGQSRGALHAMEEFFKTAGMKRLGRVVFPGSKGNNKLPAYVSNKIKRLFKA